MGRLATVWAVVLGSAAAWLAAAPAPLLAAPAHLLPAPALRASPGLPAELASWPADPRRLAQWLVGRQANAGRPFAVVDKRQAQILVFDASGQLVGRSPALLGSAPGDVSRPGVGARTAQGRLQGADRTTAAGHFASEPGHNLAGETVVWIDHDAALAIHRLRSGTGHADRRRRLAGDEPQARRVSAGCVVVPGVFFDRVVQPLLGRQRGWVLVMPEHGTAPDEPA